MDQERCNEYNLKDFASLDNGDDRTDIRECITKIMNTLSFRKLAGKTQVILSLSGPDVRTRLTHTIEVAKISRDICHKLDLNEDLAEAMALAHDIGHTPFGHVGERTLREIMCGCDTLGDKVRDFDFDNSGFKHNLQSFIVLKNLECVDTNSKGDSEYQNIWPYIFWGALAHTKMTYAKAYSGMDDEILISSKHCDWVYVCHYDEKKECKRNIQKKKRKEVNEKEICKPWYCAMLPVIEDRNKVDEEYLINNETTREYIKKEPIEEQYLDWIYCSHKCYLAKLWKHKINSKSTPENYPYLFDHPFPNSFYAKPLYDYFNNSDDNTHQEFISFEAQIVRQADEIAQRQQDLEDGINKGLFPFINAIEEVQFLIEKFNCIDTFQKELEDLRDKKTAEDLGKLLVDFYKKALIDQTRQNVKDFFYNTDKVEINIYSLMNILYSMDSENGKKPKWILKELDKLTKSASSEIEIKISCLEDYFELNLSRVYLYLLSYDYLERCTKRCEYTEDTKNILSKCIGSLIFDLNKQVEVQAEEFCEFRVAKDLHELKAGLEVLKNNNNDPLEFAYGFLKTLDLLRNYLVKLYKKECDDFFKMKKEVWKNIGWLKLGSFFVLYEVFEKKLLDKKEIISIADLKTFKIKRKYDPEKHAQDTFNKWKKSLKGNANKVLSNLVAFIDETNSDCEKRKMALENFEDTQRNTILKSEAVEKNDGKASYMLRRMFKAYITNSHQLPDLGLKYILTSLIDEIQTEFIKSEKYAFKEILDKLKKTMIDSNRTTDTIKKIWETDLLTFQPDDTEFKNLKEGKSNEIKAALEKRRKLSKYFNGLKNNRDRIVQCLNSEKEKYKDDLREQLRNLRANLDNPILNATPRWKSILTRGICDYIASLTDQEAVNEYEKLYAGIMELV